MGFIDYHQVPGYLFQALNNLILLSKIERGNTLAIAIPDITRKLIAHHLGVDYFKRFIELTIQLILPLDG